MKLRFFKINRRADSSLMDSVIFIVLNLAFAVGIILFLSKAGSGILIYEQAYAKQIALILDDARENTTLVLNIKEGVEIAKKNGKFDNLVSINDKNEVIVSLSKKGGYRYKFFSDLEVTTKLEGDYLTIIIK